MVRDAYIQFNLTKQCLFYIRVTGFGAELFHILSSIEIDTTVVYSFRN